MKTIDLSQELHTGMWVYPGDPEVNIEVIQTIEKDDWEMKNISMSSHGGTHVNVPAHCCLNGKRLEDYSLENFMGEARIFREESDIQKGIGILFGEEKDISWKTAKKCVEVGVKFIGVSKEFDIEIERYLLEKGLISFERLQNIDMLPVKCMFYGMPLKIRQGDGSPVRAYAII